MNSAITPISFSSQPRVVIAQVPIRTPLGFKAEVSPGIQFLFRVMEAQSQTISTLRPFTPYFWQSR